MCVCVYVRERESESEREREKAWSVNYELENPSDILLFTYRLSVSNQHLRIYDFTRMRFISISVS